MKIPNYIVWQKLEKIDHLISASENIQQQIKLLDTKLSVRIDSIESSTKTNFKSVKDSIKWLQWLLGITLTLVVAIITKLLIF